MVSFFKDAQQPPPYDLSNFTVLVVEDSVYMHSLISSMLKVFSVGDIMVSEGGDEAIDLLKVTQARTGGSKYINHVDIVLMDWLMAKGSGEQLLKWICSHEKDSIRFLPVIVVSGYTTNVITNKARDLGANEILVKPVSGNALASRICSVIDHPRPFIKVPDYFGPDRRRRDVAYKGEDRRKIQTEEIEVIRNVSAD